MQLPSAVETDVIVKVALDTDTRTYRESNHVSFDQIKNIPIQTMRGEVLLGYLVSEKITQATSTASHVDGEKTRTVNAYVQDGYLPVA